MLQSLDERRGSKPARYKEVRNDAGPAQSAGVGMSAAVQLGMGTAINAVRLSLGIVFLAFGYVKFFPFEVEGVAPFVMVHPLLNWMLPFIGKAGAASFLGVVELLARILILASFRFPLTGLAGGILTVITFATTVTLFLFLPGVFEESAGGFPAASGTGQFLLKDLVLFAGGLVLIAEARQRLQATR